MEDILEFPATRHPGTPLAYRVHNDLWLFASEHYDASPWLVLRRRSPSMLDEQVVDSIPGDVRRELLGRLGGVEAADIPRFNYFVGRDLRRLIRSGEIKGYHLSHDESHRLFDEEDALVYWPGDLSHPPASAGSGALLRHSRLELAEELGHSLLVRWQQADIGNRILWNEPAYQRALIRVGAAMTAIGEGALGVWQSLVALAKLGVAVVRVAGDSIRFTLRMAGNVASGDIQAAAAELRAIGIQVADTVQSIRELAERGVAFLNQLMDDAKARLMLRNYLIGMYHSVSDIDRLSRAVRFSVEIGLEVLIAIATAGAGAALAASSAVRRIGPFTVEAVNRIANMARAVRTHRNESQRLTRPDQPNEPRRSNNGDDAASNESPASQNTDAADQPSASSGNAEAGTVANGRASANEANTPTRGCPISMVTGEELLGQADFEIPGPLPLTWRRFYRSGDNTDRGLGHGWSYPGSERLHLSGERMLLEDGEGRQVPLALPAPGESSTNPLEGYTLQSLPEGEYLLRQAGMPDRRFQPSPDPDVWRLATLEDARGNCWAFHYDGRRLYRLSSSWGRRLSLRYDDDGHIQAIVDSEEHKRDSLAPPLVRYRHDASGDLVAATDRAGGSEQFAYRNHVLIQRTLKSGFAYHFEWDRHDIHGRCLRQTGNDGIYDTRFEWEPENCLSRTIDSRGGVEIFEYNAQGQIVRETNPAGGTTHYDYNAAGQLIARTDPDGARWQFAYDAHGRLTRNTDPLGATHRLQYDRQGRLTTLTDPLGNTWRRRYTPNGLLAATVDPKGHETRFRYDRDQRLVEIIPALGQSHRLEWDSRGRLAAEIDTTGRRTTYRHDAQDRITTVVTPDGGFTRYGYDPMGRVTDIHRPGEQALRFHYDQAGRITRFIDAAGRETRYRYGGLSQVEERVGPDGRTLRYEYDSERNLTALINEKGERHTFRYDAAERLIEETGFDGRRQAYRYTAAGHLVEHRDADITATFERDALGRLLCRTASDGSFAQYQYDAAGRMTRADNAACFLRFEYDATGQLAAEHQDGESLRFAHDALGRRIASHGSAGELAYGYDDTGALRNVTRNGDVLAEFLYDAHGRESLRRMGGVESRFDYDPAGRLQRQQTRHIDSGTTLSTRDYRYDAAGRLATLVDMHHGATRYHYDALDRLSRVEGLVNEPFAFDPAGNLLEDANGPAGTQAGNRLAFHGDRHFRYDARGNRIEERRGRAGLLVTRFHYNGFNQLVAVERDGEQSRYAYDALGRRVHKVTPAGDTYYTWDGDTLYSEHGPEGKRHFVFEPGTFKPLCLLTEGQTYYYHLDHLGTPRELTDPRGRVVWRTAYRAYGATEQLQATVSNPLRFQGQYFDDDTGLHYNRHRYYDPQNGRFIHQDPIGLQGGINLYEYAPNPVHWVDPLGLTCKPGDCGTTIPQPYEGQTLYRVYGGDSAAGGASWSPLNPGNVENYRDVAGLPSGGASGYNNSGRFVIEGTLNDPSKVVLQRAALPLDGQQGGIPEYIIPDGLNNGAISINRVSGVNPEF